jgi:UDP-hydrolysing UDP-N-acetyl-D-glucosamine 2-epimerase
LTAPIRIGVVTVARSDFGIYSPLLQAMKEAPDFEPVLLVSGMHVDPRFNTIGEVKKAGLPIVANFPMLEEGDDAFCVAQSMANGVSGFTNAFRKLALDYVMLLGDRFEMFSAAIAALPLQVPMIHLYGGEVTEGAIDEAIRHSITKMAHLHFTATDVFANRVKQLGEEGWRVKVAGALALDHLRSMDFVEPIQLAERLNIDFSRKVLLVTFHPVTIGDVDQERETLEFFQALEQADDFEILITHPNVDSGGGVIMKSLKQFVSRHNNAHLFGNLGVQLYFSVMRCAVAMVGNSSSGIIEAASFALPVVNVGIRQQGRLRARNVLDVACDTESIYAAIVKATSTEFRNSLKGLVNPYGRSDAAGFILNTLRERPDRQKLLSKKFIDIAPSDD